MAGPFDYYQKCAILQPIYLMPICCRVKETSCRPENFDRKHFYLEMKKEGNRPYTEIFPERLPEATGDTDIPVQTPEPELQITAQDPAPKPELIHRRKYITEEETKA
uniref:Uncharacterized protein n=1 Tax=Rhizophagus irregularis (strain DAOM 181602 / DAOM 197198 / MUCL 43194) TaxID=747089 RepID=U9SV66_RHIID